MDVVGRILLALVIALTSLSAMSPKRADPPADNDEIRIGNLMPYSGSRRGVWRDRKGRSGVFRYDQRARRTSTAARCASSPRTTNPIPLLR